MGDAPPIETEPTFTAREWRRVLIEALYLERQNAAGPTPRRVGEGMIGAMHSLEMECQELQNAGVITEPAAAQAAALERGTIFSVFEELRFALYAAVAAIIAGIGLLVKDNLDRIGPLTLIVVLALASSGCYAMALRTQWQRKERSSGGDYLLLLGALIVSADLGYAESQFHWLGTEWQWYLLILAAFHGVTAYRLRSRLVLCTSIAALAAWFGIEGRVATLFNVGGSSSTLGIHAIVCAGTLLLWRAANRRLGGPKSFESVLENFAANIGFWGALALSLTPGSRVLGLGLLAALAAASTFKALRSEAEIFAVYGTAYAALTLCCLEAQVIEYGLGVLLLELATVVAGALLLWSFHRRAAARS
jgi:hypothetical protein